MNLRAVLTVVGLLLAAICPDVAHAQPAAPGPTGAGRGYLGADGGMQATATNFASKVNVNLYAEPTTFDSTYDVKSGLFVGARAGMRVWRNLSVGLGVSQFSKSGNASIKATLPHPFYFNHPRPVSGTATGLSRDELGIHLEVGWLLTVAQKVDVMLFAGPSAVRVRQDLITQLQVNETYPFDTATYAGVNRKSASKSAIGFNVGMDLTYAITKSVGVGALVRFTRATVSLSATEDQNTKASASATAGGFQFGAGLRLRF